MAADWSPGNSELAIVRRDRVEFPVGTTVYGPNAFSFVRVAPDGQRLALIDGHSIVVLDRSGRKKTLSSGWAAVIRLAWSPSGDEVWFTAFRRGPNDTSGWVLRAVSLAGRERVILPSMGAPFGHSGCLPGWSRPDSRAGGEDGMLVPATGTDTDSRGLVGRWFRAPRRSRRMDARCSSARSCKAPENTARPTFEERMALTPSGLATGLAKTSRRMANGS